MAMQVLVWRSSELIFFFFFATFFFAGAGIAASASDACKSDPPPKTPAVAPGDVDLIQFALNLEHLEADFFLFGALGRGLDTVDPNLTLGGSPPLGAQKANLDPLTRAIIEEFGYQEVGHLRAIRRTVGGFPRVFMDLRKDRFAEMFDAAVGYKLVPPFNPYQNTINYLLASYLIPYVGLVGYVGTNPLLAGYESKRLLAGLLAVESGQDAVIRALLYMRAQERVMPYGITVAEFTRKLSGLRNKLAGCGSKDEGLIVPKVVGAENKTSSNVLSADPNSVAYSRTPAEILRIIYGTNNESLSGGIFPIGAGGKIAQGFLGN